MKGTSVMWNYIMEEQEVLGRMLCDKALFETASDVPELESVYIVAHGSSYNASVVMADFLSRYMSVRVYGYTPANFMHNCVYKNFLQPEPVNVLLPNYSSMPISIN